MALTNFIGTIKPFKECSLYRDVEIFSEIWKLKTDNEVFFKCMEFFKELVEAEDLEVEQVVNEDHRMFHFRSKGKTNVDQWLNIRENEGQIIIEFGCPAA